MSRRWPGQLAAGLRAMRIGLGRDCEARLLQYLALLRHWNRAFNLTAIRDPEQMVRRHLLDSLSILPWVDAGPVLDVGSGAGLPGVPLALARPDIDFVLLDSNAKKTRFLRQAVAELGLANVEVVNQRVEQLVRPAGFARIVSRAFASLDDMVSASEHLLAPGGCWLAMKGPDPGAEIASLPQRVSADAVALAVPGERAGRCLVVVRSRSGTRGPATGPGPAD